MEYNGNLKTKTVKKMNESNHLLSKSIRDVYSKCEFNYLMCDTLRKIQENELNYEIILTALMIDIAILEALDLGKPWEALELAMQVRFSFIYLLKIFKQFFYLNLSKVF